MHAPASTIVLFLVKHGVGHFARDMVISPRHTIRVDGQKCHVLVCSIGPGGYRLATDAQEPSVIVPLSEGVMRAQSLGGTRPEKGKVQNGSDSSYAR
jgi:hypothetical protein